MSIQALLDRIPFVAKTGVQCEDYSPGRVVLSVSPRDGNTNHVDSMHAGVVFTLAETASAAACATHPVLARYELFCRGVNIRYRRAASGRVTAHCEVTPELAEAARAAIADQGTTDFDVLVEVLDGHGNLVAEVVGAYRLRKPKAVTAVPL